MTNEEKYKRLTGCLNKWLKCVHEEKLLADYLEYKSIASVAVYGYGILGKNAVRELSIHEFPILWIADRRKIGVMESFPTYLADQLEDAPQPDLIIISSVTDVEEIEKKLQGIFQCLIITIEELIDCISGWGSIY